MTPDPAALLPVALRAADAAADMMRNRPPASVTEKHDRDLVSDVDVAIERQIRALLGQATPDIGFIGEEEGQTGDPRAGWMWTLDPIDGTSNFAHGIPLCATSLALVHGSRAVLGVIDAPFLGHRYHAVEGQGAYAGDHQLSVSSTRHLRDAVVALGDYATGPRADLVNEARLAVTVRLAPRVHRLRMIGTAALDLAWVAEGRFDGSITLGNKPWDTAAGVLIAREAGATVIDADGSPHTMDSAATIAAAPGLIDQLILAVRAAGGRQLDAHPDKETGKPPYAALDAVLGAARNLIFEFDGPICDFRAALPDAAEQLRALAGAGRVALPPAVARTDDPLEVLAWGESADVGAALRMDAELARLEAEAAAVAAPSAYVHEVIAACRDSGRNPVMVSRQSGDAVRAWLARFGLAETVPHVAGAGRYPPGHLQEAGNMMAEAIRQIGAEPGECALITSSPASVPAARATGVRCIGYARRPADGDRLSDAGADSVVLSLADLTLRLRARPLAH